jgi:transmembrane protein TMEM260 (protein O-mannosyltransferase)
MNRSDKWLAAAATAGAFAIYVVTLAPGLIAITDTPKFQFIGRILGTAHPPGYPLYVLVSYVFGYVPIGSLAYRINLMSAVFGAAACGLTYLAARRLGAGRLVAVLSALTMACGSTVWYVSTIAEVYALEVCLVAGVALALLVWRDTRVAAWFYAAVALVGVSLGHHITAVFLIPAVAAFAFLAAPRFAFRARTIVWSAAITAAALLQYLFVLVRTRQGAWGEAPASTLSELARVATGAEYFRDVMPDGAGVWVTRLLPLLRPAFEREMSAIGLACAALGIIALWHRSKPALAFLLVAALEYAAFGAAYTPKDFEVFLVPAFLMCWLLAAAGAQWLLDVARTRAGAPAVVPLVAALMVAPAWQFTHNYGTRDLSHARADMRFFDALFDRLPEGSAVLHEDFLVDRMVYYKTLGEQVTRGRRVLALVPAEIDRVKRVWQDGYQVFAFPHTAKMMRLLDGADFGRAPLDLTGGTLARYLDDLPRGAIVAIGVPAGFVANFAQSRQLPLQAVGFTRRLTALDAAGGVAVIGRRGGAAVEAIPDSSAVFVRLEASSGDTAEPPRAPIVVRADRNAASIELGGREMLRTSAGMAVAVWTSGRLAAAFVLSASAPSPPTLPTPYDVYPLRGFRERQTIDASAIDLTATTAGGLFVYKADAGPSRFVMYAGRERPLAPELLDCSARNWPMLGVRAFEGPQSADGELARALADDSMPPSPTLMKMPHVYRLVLETNWSVAAAIQIGLGGVPDASYGRLLDGAPGHIYGLDPSGYLKRMDERTLALQMARDYQEQLFGAGWSEVQVDGAGPYRQTVAQEAELMLPLSDVGAGRIGVQLLALPGSNGLPRSVELRIGGHVLPSITPAPEWRRYWWIVPAEILRRGINPLVLAVSPDKTRIAVSDMLIEATTSPSSAGPARF